MLHLLDFKSKVRRGSIVIVIFVVMVVEKR